MLHNLDSFLCQPGGIIDVRSPSEHNQGRIPTSHNIPLFSDSERAHIGTLYKMHGQEAAVTVGKEIVLPKLDTLISCTQKHTQKNTLRVHCWRGGLRSTSFAKVLSKRGFEVFLLDGGYKSYRKYALQSFENKWNLRILGGLTGSGKTEKLYALKKQGEQILDLEKLACHRGSSFGAMDQLSQPSNEQFENEIAWQLRHLNPKKPIWIEDESRLIGGCRIPSPLFNTMQKAQVFLIKPSKDVRVERLVKEYGQSSKAVLIEGVNRIQKRLGGLRTRQAIEWIHQGDLHSAAELLLTYYDKAYEHTLKGRKVCDLDFNRVKMQVGQKNPPSPIGEKGP